MKSNSDSNKVLSVEEYLDKIRRCSKHVINNLKKSDNWKIQLKKATNFISSKSYDTEWYVVHSKSYNNKIMINVEADEVIEQLFKPIKDRSHNNLQKLMKLSKNISKSSWITYRFSWLYKKHKNNNKHYE